MTLCLYFFDFGGRPKNNNLIPYLNIFYAIW